MWITIIVSCINIPIIIICYIIMWVADEIPRIVKTNSVSFGESGIIFHLGSGFACSPIRISLF